MSAPGWFSAAPLATQALLLPALVALLALVRWKSDRRAAGALLRALGLTVLVGLCLLGNGPGQAALDAVGAGATRLYAGLEARVGSALLGALLLVPLLAGLAAALGRITSLHALGAHLLGVWARWLGSPRGAAHGAVAGFWAPRAGLRAPGVPALACGYALPAAGSLLVLGALGLDLRYGLVGALCAGPLAFALARAAGHPPGPAPRPSPAPGRALGLGLVWSLRMAGALLALAGVRALVGRLLDPALGESLGAPLACSLGVPLEASRGVGGHLLARLWSEELAAADLRAGFAGLEPRGWLIASAFIGAAGGVFRPFLDPRRLRPAPVALPALGSALLAAATVAALLGGLYVPRPAERAAHARAAFEADCAALAFDLAGARLEAWERAGLGPPPVALEDFRQAREAQGRAWLEEAPELWEAGRLGEALVRLYVVRRLGWSPLAREAERRFAERARGVRERVDGYLAVGEASFAEDLLQSLRWSPDWPIAPRELYAEVGIGRELASIAAEAGRQ